MKSNYFVKRVLVTVVVLSLIIGAGIIVFGRDKAAIHIAFAGPISGDSAIVGEFMTQAIQLYLDTVNEQGGIHGKPVVLDIFDDQNEANKALEVANEIARQNQAIAVIGHNYSACSINAGKVYKQQQIPAITPVSTNIQVTQDNDWYFRTVFNDDSQARFLVHYAKHLLQQKMVSIIHTDDTYGAYLASQFEQASRKLNLAVRYHDWSFSSENPDARITEIVNELQTKSDAGLIFLATQAPEGVKLIKAIREAGITNLLMAPDSYASKRFSEGFSSYPKEKLTPGYYTNGLYVSTPFLLDTAKRPAHYFNARYQEEYHQNQQLPWHAFYAVDAAMVLVEALKHAPIQAQSDTLVADRKAIRDTLANFNTVENAVKGNTGLNYFDKNGDATKSISMGVYKNNHLISAFEQLKIMPHYSAEKSESPKATDQEGRILLIDDRYMYKTDVVYTGIHLNSISDFNFKKATYTLNFDLWFRFQGDIKPEPHLIEFLNAVEPIQLGKMVQETKLGQQNYQLYKVKGQFKGNPHTSESHTSLTLHLLGVSFRHRELDQNRLIYVADVLGMELTNKTFLLQSLIQELQEQSALDDWTIQEIKFFQGIAKQKLLGNPKYLTLENSLEHSTFNVDIWMLNNAYTYYTFIPFKLVIVFLVFSGVMTLLLILVSYKNQKIYRLKSLWFVQIIFAFMLLLSTEMLAIHWMIEHPNTLLIETTITVFQVLWWIIPAILLHMAVERFFWLPLEEKTGRKVPNLMRFLTALLIYMLVLFGIIGFVFERPLTSLLATSGVAAMIVGLAVQMNLSNVFSGIALNIERSLRIGDWVKIGAFDEGKVSNMNWRVTQIETRRGYILSIPNSTVSNTDIHNFSYPDEQYWLLCRVPVDPKHDPRKVEQILMTAVLSVELDVVKDFTPSVWIDTLQIENVSEWVASYLVFYKTENYQHKFRVMKNVWKSIWIHLNQAGMIPYAATIPVRENEAEQQTVAIPSGLATVLSKHQLQNMIKGTS